MPMKMINDFDDIRDEKPSFEELQRQVRKQVELLVEEVFALRALVARYHAFLVQAERAGQMDACQAQQAQTLQEQAERLLPTLTKTSTPVGQASSAWGTGAPRAAVFAVELHEKGGEHA